MLFNFTPMTSIEELKQKHLKIKNDLYSLSKSKIGKGNTIIACQEVSKILQVSQQTVYNYLTGSIKDGYLAEAILKELKKYKPTK